AQLLIEVVQTLETNNIPYCVIGALAAAIHGVVRASIDADLVVFFRDRAFDADKLARVLEKMPFSVVLRKGDLYDPISALLQITDTFGNRVDLLVGVRGLPVDVMERAIEESLFGHTLRFIGAEDFIISKITAGGPIDLHD